MSKRTNLVNVANTYDNTGSINTNLERLNRQFDNTISRDGSSPNAMEADLDMNSNDILNVKDLHIQGDLKVDGVGGLKEYVEESKEARDQAQTAQGLAEDAQGFAEAAQAAAEAAFRDFDKRYLGPYPAAPSLDLNGDPIVTGALYFDTVLEALRVYDGSGWVTIITAGALLASANLSDVDSAATSRTNLGLGNVATRDVVSSTADTTSGRVPTVGWMGLGTPITIDSGTDLNDLTTFGLYRHTAGDLPSNIPVTDSGIVVVLKGSSGSWTQQFWYRRNNTAHYHRTNAAGGPWTPWVRLVDEDMKATQPQAEAGTNNDAFMTPLRTAQAIAELAEGGIPTPQAGDVFSQWFRPGEKTTAHSTTDSFRKTAIASGTIRLKGEWRVNHSGGTTGTIAFEVNGVRVWSDTDRPGSYKAFSVDIPILLGDRLELLIGAGTNNAITTRDIGVFLDKEGVAVVPEY